MKKLLSIIVVMTIMGAVSAQVNFYPMKKSDTLRSKTKKDSLIVKVPDTAAMKIGVFVSMLAESEVPFDAIRWSPKTHIRGGYTLQAKIWKWLSFNSFGALQWNSDTTLTTTLRYWMQVQPLKGVSIDLGSIVSVPNEQRPPAVSDGGVFEAFTPQHIPGGGLGIKLKYNFAKKWEVSASAIERKKLPEYAIGFGYKDKAKKREVKLAGWYTQAAEKNKWYGAALTMKFKLLSTTLVWNQDQLLSNVLCWNLPKHWNVYTDVGVSLQNYKLVRAELGFLKNWEITFSPGVVTKILVGPAFNYENRAVELYFQIGF